MTRPRKVSAAPKRKHPKPAPVVVMHVDPRVWTTALELAHGEVARIRRVSPTEVIVLNQPTERSTA